MSIPRPLAAEAESREDILKRNNLTPANVKNRYGLDIYDQKSLYVGDYLTHLKSMVLSLLRPTIGKQVWLDRAPTYRDSFLSQMHNREHIIMLDVLNKYRPERVTEIGCGWGKNLDLIFKFVPSVTQATAIDVSPVFLDQCRETLAGKHVRFIQSAFEDIEPACLDGWVVVFNTFMYCRPKSLRNLREVLSRHADKLLLLREPCYARGNCRMASAMNYYHNYFRVFEAFSHEVLRDEESFVSILVDFSASHSHDPVSA